MSTTDVVVVGGGPAGSVTALLLARAGHAVTLLERQEFPRAKPCGDCLSPGANPILRRIGVWEDVMATQPARLPGWRMTAPGQQSFMATFETITGSETFALAVERSRFDAVLLAHARQAGVNIVTGARVTDVLRGYNDQVTGVSLLQNGEPKSVHARLTIGADGLRSIIARRLQAHARRPRLRKVSFTLHVRRPIESGLGVMRVTRNACLGSAPVEQEHGEAECLHNVTLVLNQATFAAHRSLARIVAAGLARFDFDVPDVQDHDILTSGPFDWPTRHVIFSGAALVGDAAGYYDPFTGQGIYQALAGAELLAEHADAALRFSGSLQLRAYGAAQQRLTAASRRLQRIIEFVCARPRLADHVFAKLARESAVANALVGVTGDLLPARSLLSARLLMRLAA